MAAYSSAHNAIHPASFVHAAPVAAPVVPAGTFVPGTVITVGSHTCTIDRYLSEGGFAHVYLVRLSRPINGNDVAVLKRVAVADKEQLSNMRTEVETMKRLKGHKHIVTYIDSHASHLKTGGYEVFLLMEYCSGGGLIDFMNTRLKNRLTEPEVLHIFSDIAEGVACMHYLKPPLLHRDLKVENVLIASSRRFVLCDFGSSAAVRPAPSTPEECRAVEEDVMRHTTLQYRSPEMIDVYRKQPIDEKSDIWALGVLLYKLCYYTTPFEEHGQLAILNAKYKFPLYPEFSDRLKKLIASMLRENPQLRPNIYQVLKEACAMRGKEVPIKDIYGNRALQSINKPLPMSPPAQSVIAFQSPPPQQQQMVIPEITPMRRGRPTRASNPVMPTQQAHSHSRPRPPASDPFAALDSQRPATAAPSSVSAYSSPDEASARFPSLDQFDLMHQSGSRFEFKASPLESPRKDLSTKVMERLADEAFVKPTGELRRPGTMERERLVAEAVKTGEMSNISLSKPALYEPQPTRPVMASKGTMTSPSPSPPRERDLHQKVPSAPPANSAENMLMPVQKRPGILPIHRTSTQPLTTSSQLSTATISSRPSLEVPRNNTSAEPIQVPAIARSKSANSKPRPQSVHIESNMDFLRDLDSATTAPTDILTTSGNNSPTHIPSNVDFLRSMESPQNIPPPHHGHSLSLSAKRASLPSISLGTTRNLLSSKFGDAFRRFEHPGPSLAPQPPITPPSPSDSLSSEWTTMTPESKRELEKRQLEAEERRVRQKAEEHKRNTTASTPTSSQQPGPRPRPSAEKIQRNVRSAILVENTRDAIPSPGLLSANKVPPPTPSKPAKLRTTASAVLRERAPGSATEEDWERGFEKRFPKLEDE